jgi:hypothetical protein
MSKTKQSQFPTISLNGHVIFVIKLNGKTEYMLAKTVRSMVGQTFKTKQSLFKYLGGINENLEKEARSELKVLEEAEKFRQEARKLRPGLITSRLPF